MKALTEALVKLTKIDTPSKKQEIKKVDTTLQKSLVESVNKVNKNTCRNSNDLTIAYQRALQEGIEKIYPNSCWYDITKCDIYATLCETKNDVNATIDRILTEEIITGKTEEEYFDKYGDMYDAGELWDFSRDDIETGAIEPDDNVDYWLIGDRYFEAPKELTEDADEFSDEEIEVESEELPTEVDIAFDDFDISLEDGIELVLKHKFDNEVSDFDYDVHDDSVSIHDIEWKEDEEEQDDTESEEEKEELTEDTVKQGSHWVNKGKEGTHGKFKTKKAADAQRKAMFANGYKGEELNEAHADLSQKEHTIAHALGRTKDEWANAKTEKEAVSILRRALEDEGLNTPATRKFLWHISNQPLNKIIETATNYWMSGADLSMKKGTPGYDKGFRGKHEALTEEESDQVVIDRLKAGATLKDALK